MPHRSAQQLREHNSRRARAAAVLEDERRRTRRLVAMGAVVVIVLVVIVVMVVVKLSQHNSGPAQAVSASGKVTSAITTVPASAYDKAGAGAVRVIPLKDAPPLTSGGKPEVLYVGAEYCPYCAAERWALVTALSRFGTFQHLGQTTSTSSDVYPDTPTLSFYGSTFTSKQFVFRSFETYDRSGQPLQTLTPAVQATIDKYGREPYVPSVSASQPPPIPFIDIAGKYVIDGASYDPQLLHGMTHVQVAQAIRKPGSAISKAVLSTANTISAMICQQTGGQPGNVCTSSGVKAAAATLP